MLDSNEWIKFVCFSISLSLLLHLSLRNIFKSPCESRKGSVLWSQPTRLPNFSFCSRIFEDFLPPSFMSLFKMHCLENEKHAVLLRTVYSTYFATWLYDRWKPNQVDRFCFPPYKRQGIKRWAETYREAGQRTCDFCSRRAGYTDDDDEERKKER